MGKELGESRRGDVTTTKAELDFGFALLWLGAIFSRASTNCGPVRGREHELRGPLIAFLGGTSAFTPRPCPPRPRVSGAWSLGPGARRFARPAAARRPVRVSPPFASPGPSLPTSLPELQHQSRFSTRSGIVPAGRGSRRRRPSPRGIESAQNGCQPCLRAPSLCRVRRCRTPATGRTRCQITRFSPKRLSPSGTPGNGDGWSTRIEISSM